MKALQRTYLLLVLLLAPALARAEAITAPESPVNKLLYMYRFYYLPFSLEFQEGRTTNDVLPFFPGENKSALKLLQAEELESLDRDWNRIKANYRPKSLFLTTQVAVGESKRISPHLASHRVALNRGAFDTLSINDRIVLSNALKSKSPPVQAAFTQLRFLKSFLGPQDEGKFVFFIVGPSWCESSREYRVLLESYFKEFPNSSVSLHSILIEDPKEQIFNSQILKSLFPNPQRYSHNNLPRFLALEANPNGTTNVYEEGEALQILYDRFFAQHRGFLDEKTQLLRGRPKPKVAPQVGIDPMLSSVEK